MQRPVMNPAFYEEQANQTSSAPRKPWRVVLGILWKPFRSILRFLTYDPLMHIGRFRAEEHSRIQKFIRAFMYRLAFVPVAVAALSCAVVWVSTHPRSVTTETDPAGQGIYYEPVTFVGAGNTRIEGWLVPVLEAKTVLDQRDKVLRHKQPAVVLLHDIGQRRGQLLPMIKPLHEAGFVVLAINLRGGGNSATAGETFGLNEAGDVRAGVEMLRRRPFVDADKIALVGCGTGATAALLTAQQDPQIAAVVANRPIQSTEELVKGRLVPNRIGMRWIAPLCKWTFEIAYKVDVEEAALENFSKMFKNRHTLLLDRGPYADPADAMTVDQVLTYLQSVMGPKEHLAGAK
jgi:pimeloyl-ACP methyl ester carboxylesterase